MKFNKKSLVRVAILSAILGLNGMCFDNMVNAAAEVTTEVGYQRLTEKEMKSLAKAQGYEEKDKPYCSICLDNNANVETECLHTYCARCIESWLQEHETCPYCRAIIRPKQEERKDPTLEQAKKDKDKKERQLLLNKLVKATKGLPETTRMQFLKDMDDASRIVGYEMDIVAKIKKTLDAGGPVTQDMLEELHLQNNIKNNIIDAWGHELTNNSEKPLSQKDVEAVKTMAVEKPVAELRSIHDNLLKQALKAGDNGDYALQDRLMEQLGNIETTADELEGNDHRLPEQVAYELNAKEKERAYEMAQVAEICRRDISKGYGNQNLMADFTQAQNEYYNTTGVTWNPENSYTNNSYTNNSYANNSYTNNYANYNTANYTNYSNNYVQPQPVWNNQFADNRQMVYVY
jgi:hypothetical protein